MFSTIWHLTQENTIHVLGVDHVFTLTEALANMLKVKGVNYIIFLQGKQNYNPLKLNSNKHQLQLWNPIPQLVYALSSTLQAPAHPRWLIFASRGEIIIWESEDWGTLLKWRDSIAALSALVATSRGEGVQSFSFRMLRCDNNKREFYLQASYPYKSD